MNELDDAGETQHCYILLLLLEGYLPVQHQLHAAVLTMLVTSCVCTVDSSHTSKRHKRVSVTDHSSGSC
jgi:hypothetical protein